MEARRDQAPVRDGPEGGGSEEFALSYARMAAAFPIAGSVYSYA